MLKIYNALKYHMIMSNNTIFSISAFFR